MFTWVCLAREPAATSPREKLLLPSGIWDLVRECERTRAERPCTRFFALCGRTFALVELPLEESSRGDEGLLRRGGEKTSCLASDDGFEREPLLTLPWWSRSPRSGLSRDIERECARLLDDELEGGDNGGTRSAACMLLRLAVRESDVLTKSLLWREWRGRGRCSLCFFFAALTLLPRFFLRPLLLLLLLLLLMPPLLLLERLEECDFELEERPRSASADDDGGGRAAARSERRFLHEE